MTLTLLFSVAAGLVLSRMIGRPLTDMAKVADRLARGDLRPIDPVQRILAPRFWAGVLS